MVSYVETIPQLLDIGELLEHVFFFYSLPPPPTHTHTALFYKLGPVARNTSAPQELALFADDCAASCVESKDFLCYSFDFCDADSDNPSCLLSGYRLSANINSQDGSNSAASSLTCTRYIREWLFYRS